MLTTTGGILIRTPVADMRLIGRNTLGVRLIRVEEGDSVSSLAKLPEEELAANVELEAARCRRRRRGALLCPTTATRPTSSTTAWARLRPAIISMRPSMRGMARSRLEYPRWANSSTTIRAAVRDDRYLVSWHADERAEERGVTAWQLVAEFDQAELVRERPRSKPNPSIVVRQTLIDGTEVEVIWSWLSRSRRAILVTVYFRD